MDHTITYRYGRVSWGSIGRVIETDAGLLLALSRAELIVIPRRALPSTGAFADLAREVREKLRANVDAARAGQLVSRH
jgi:hypothetical protein